MTDVSPTVRPRPAIASGAARFELNCLECDFSCDSLKIWRIPYEDDTKFRALREEHSADWFFLRRGSSVIALPITATPKNLPGAPETFSLKGYEGLDVARARLDSVLPGLLPKYAPQHVRPFRFLAQKDEFVEEFAKEFDLPEIVRTGFSIRPKFELEARIIELAEGRLQLVVAFSVRMHWECNADLAALDQAGVDLKGLYVVTREQKPGERRFVGRISAVDAKSATLDEATDERASVDLKSVKLEGSKATFKAVLTRLIGGLYSDFEKKRDEWEARFITATSTSFY